MGGNLILMRTTKSIALILWNGKAIADGLLRADGLILVPPMGMYIVERDMKFFKVTLVEDIGRSTDEYFRYWANAEQRMREIVCERAATEEFALYSDGRNRKRTPHYGDFMLFVTRHRFEDI
jgi:hypothetical protein